MIGRMTCPADPSRGTARRTQQVTTCDLYMGRSTAPWWGGPDEALGNRKADCFRDAKSRRFDIRTSGYLVNSTDEPRSGGRIREGSVAWDGSSTQRARSGSASRRAVPVALSGV